jgi:predicted transcriptional regulator
MAGRRPIGALENEILGVLWNSDGPMTPSDVLAGLDGDLAYTTVMTVLGRLWNKGLVERVRIGRAFAYSAAISEADLSADRMRAALDRSSDSMATMSHFVASLDPASQEQLRALLKKRSK